MRGGFGWKPGDVAAVRKGGREVHAAYYDTGAQRGWFYGNGLASHHWFMPDEGTQPRPLVVIDPEDREQVEALMAALPAYLLDKPVSRVQDGLRSLIADPKPEEPQGLGAVVEDEEGRTWVRINRDTEMWRLCEGKRRGRFAPYDDITAVRVLSEGVTP